MSGFYRFPAMAGLDERTNRQQARKVAEEATKARTALVAMEALFDEAFTTMDDADYDTAERARDKYGMDLLDVIHASETALRMEFAQEKVEHLRDAVERKNRERGYYDER